MTLEQFYVLARNKNPNLAILRFCTLFQLNNLFLKFQINFGFKFKELLGSFYLLGRFYLVAKGKFFTIMALIERHLVSMLSEFIVERSIVTTTCNLVSKCRFLSILSSELRGMLVSSQYDPLSNLWIHNTASAMSFHHPVLQQTPGKQLGSYCESHL